MVAVGQHPLMDLRPGQRALLADVGIVLAVPLALLAIHHLVPAGVQATLAFDHAAFNVHALLTATYVHASDAHLRSNLVGYLLAALYTLVLCHAAGERAWFRRTLVFLLVVVPVFVNLGSYAVFRTLSPAAEPVSRGFSGVVAAFGGFLLVALAVYVRKRYSPAAGRAAGLGTFLLLLAEVDVVYAGGLRPLVALLVGAGLLLLAASLLRTGEVGLGPPVDRAVLLDGVAVALVVAVLSVVVLNLFPADIVRDGALTNIFAHALGFVFGAITAVATSEELLPRL